MNNLNTKKLYIAIILIVAGFILRMLFVNSIGLQDAEWWRAWMYQLQYSGPIQIYALEDCQQSLMDALKNAKLLEAPFTQKGCQSVVEFSANEYWRTKFPVVQPQLFYIQLWLVKIIGNWLLIEDYILISYFNSFYTILITVVFFGIASKLKFSSPIIFALVTGWSNPILILNGNIQLYQDVFMILLLSIGFYVGLVGRLKTSILIYGIALLFKPSVLFLFPLLFYFYGFNVILLPIPLIISLSIHYFNGSFVGYMVSILSITDTMAMNGSEGLGFFKLIDAVIFLIGKTNYEFLAIEIIFISKIFSLLILGFIVIKSILLKKMINFNFSNCDYFEKILLLSVMVIYFRFGLQVNHWLILFPFMMIGLILAKNSKLIIFLLVSFFIQDLIYGGVYRGSGLVYLTRFNGYFFVPLSFFVGCLILFWYHKLFFLKKEASFESLSRISKIANK
jgi:hypothetical protein